MAQSEAYNVNVGQWPRYSGFTKLNPAGHTIRLLNHESGLGTDYLRYTMRHAALETLPIYCALSYCWGAPVPPRKLKEIVIEHERVLVRPTIHSFLTALAHRKPGADLWIDVLCINQGNEAERNHQVSFMGDIYQTAQEVYIWLGLGDDDTDYALEHITNSKPETIFNQHSFAACVEKLFQSSYWSRRWVIQEFGQARDLSIVCGMHVIKWHLLLQHITERTFYHSSRAKDVFLNFRDLHSLLSSRNDSLLCLMERFRNSRCTDIRDRAFALRGLAVDGNRVIPHYDESVVDLFFRLLSTSLTQRVLPKMTGYRWPHESAVKLRTLLELPKQDLLRSLAGRAEDRLFSVFEYVGRIGRISEPSAEGQGQNCASKCSAFPFKIALEVEDNITHVGPPGHDFTPSKPVPDAPLLNEMSDHLTSEVLTDRYSLRANGNPVLNDLVYSLQTTGGSPKGIYIAFNPDGQEARITSVLIKPSSQMGMTPMVRQELDDNLKLIAHHMKRGISRCSKNEGSVSARDRVLCHINRMVLFILWFLETGGPNWPEDVRKELSHDIVGNPPECTCYDKTDRTEDASVDFQDRENRPLEVLPSFRFDGEVSFYPEQMPLPWYDIEEQSATPPPDTPRKLDSLQSLENLGWSPIEVDLDGDQRGSAQHYAAEKGYALFMEQSLSGNATPWDGFGRLLYAASVNGRENVLRVLIAAGADVNMPVNEFMCRGVKRRGNAEINTPGMPVKSLLCLAAERNYSTLAKVLLSAGAHVDGGGEDLHTPLGCACKNGYQEVVNILLDAGADINTYYRARESPLYTAVKGGYTTLVQKLIDKGANLDPPGISLLYLAADRGDATLVKLLLDAGADVNGRHEDLYTPLGRACRKGKQEVADVLLAGKADINAYGRASEGALCAAVLGGHKSLAQKLLAAGADVDSKMGGVTPLFYAAWHGDVDLVHLLLVAGADVNRTGENGRSAVWAAYGANHTAVLQILRDRGGEVVGPDLQEPGD